MTWHRYFQTKALDMDIDENLHDFVCIFECIQRVQPFFVHKRGLSA